MDLLALADFNLVARHGGFGRAAREAGRPKATLSRRVAELEASLDLRLFERGARSLKLTEEGRALFERAGLLLTELEETAAAIASGGQAARCRQMRRTSMIRWPRFRIASSRFCDCSGRGAPAAKSRRTCT